MSNETNVVMKNMTNNADVYKRQDRTKSVYGYTVCLLMCRVILSRSQ